MSCKKYFKNKYAGEDAISEQKCTKSTLSNVVKLKQRLKKLYDGLFNIFFCSDLSLRKIGRKSVQKQSFYWSVFSCIRTEYGDFLVRIFLYSD